MSIPERLAAALSDRYRIERELGAGGMATVYLADDLKHKRQVAIKVLKPELAAVVGSARFLTEIETTAALQHPHILPLFDSGDADGFLFYVMPYVDGESLRERLDRDKQLPVGEAVGIAAKVAGALQAAHGAGVIHRDIKPANILLANGEPLVADFGIALAVQEAGGGRLTETGLSLGTPFYMSPEQATADRAVSPGTDVYSLGCVLYEMLVGEPPYVGSTAQAVLGKILTDEPRRPTRVRSTVPAHVEAAVMRALEKLPADRFATAGEFLKALEDSSFRHGADGGNARAGSRRGPSPLWWVATAALGIVAIVFGGLLVARGEPVAPETVRFTVSLPEGVSPYPNSGVNLALSPDGSGMVFVAVRDRTESLWHHRFDRLVPQPLPGTAGARSPRFSPGGDAIAFLARGGLHRIGLDGGLPLTLVPDSVQAGSGGIAWGDDGFIYFVVAGGVRRIAEGGGTVEMVVPRGDQGSERSWPDVLPDGRGVLLTRNFGSASRDSIAVADLETGQVRTLLAGAMARWSDSGHILFQDGEGALYAVPFDPVRLEITGAPQPLVEGIQLNTGSAGQFTIAPSGTLAYLTGTGSADAVAEWLNADGELERAWPSEGPYDAPAVSPDGRYVAIEVRAEDGSQIWVRDLEGGAFFPVTFAGDNFLPFWHPDSRRIAFIRESGDRPGIYSVPVDLSTDAELLWTIEPYDEHDPLIGRWTPDGERLLVSVDRDRLLLTYPHPDSAAVVWHDPPGNLLYGEPSPDGNWIAYASNESGSIEVYVRPFPGPGGQRQITTGDSEAAIFHWMPDGSSILYGSRETGVVTLARLRSPSDPSVLSREVYWDSSARSTRVILDLFTTDLAPDGRMLVLNYNVTGQVGRELVIVTNWASEFRRTQERRP